MAPHSPAAQVVLASARERLVARAAAEAGFGFCEAAALAAVAEAPANAAALARACACERQAAHRALRRLVEEGLVAGEGWYEPTAAGRRVLADLCRRLDAALPAYLHTRFRGAGLAALFRRGRRLAARTERLGLAPGERDLLLALRLPEGERALRHLSAGEVTRARRALASRGLVGAAGSLTPPGEEEAERVALVLVPVVDEPWPAPARGLDEATLQAPLTAELLHLARTAARTAATASAPPATFVVDWAPLATALRPARERPVATV